MSQGDCIVRRIHRRNRLFPQARSLVSKERMTRVHRSACRPSNLGDVHETRVIEARLPRSSPWVNPPTRLRLPACVVRPISEEIVLGSLAIHDR